MFCVVCYLNPLYAKLLITHSAIPTYFNLSQIEVTVLFLRISIYLKLRDFIKTRINHSELIIIDTNSKVKMIPT